jgi:hypothetical protein
MSDEAISLLTGDCFVEKSALLAMTPVFDDKFSWIMS